MTHVQPSLLDALAARDNALARVEAAAPKGWNERALDAVYALADRYDTFTSEHVWGSGLEKPPEPRALGPVLKKAVTYGWCVPGEYVKSGMHSRHLAPVRKYHSLLRLTGTR